MRRCRTRRREGHGKGIDPARPGRPTRALCSARRPSPPRREARGGHHRPGPQDRPGRPPPAQRRAHPRLLQRPSVCLGAPRSQPATASPCSPGRSCATTRPTPPQERWSRPCCGRRPESCRSPARTPKSWAGRSWSWPDRLAPIPGGQQAVRRPPPPRVLLVPAVPRGRPRLAGPGHRLGGDDAGAGALRPRGRARLPGCHQRAQQTVVRAARLPGRGGVRASRGAAHLADVAPASLGSVATAGLGRGLGLFRPRWERLRRPGAGARGLGPAGRRHQGVANPALGRMAGQPMLMPV